MQYYLFLERTKLCFSKAICLSLSFLCLSLLSVEVEGQCVTTASEEIPDDGILTIDFLVTGLVDNDLASPTQGICGIEIDFMHEYLGDLTVSLISPSGTRIELIGPVTTSTTPTNLSRWNIEFVPCLSPAVPDAGFADVWTNLQAWQIFTNYSGSYHPNAGCLEDFSTGSANGKWQVIFEDNDVLQIGNVASITLVFCNPTGLQCMECSPNAGTLSPPAITLCVGENISSSDILVDFGGNTPSPAIYSYAYVMTSGNSIIRSGSAFSENPLPGVYTICGLSYLTSDTMTVNNMLAAGDFNMLAQAIGSGSICAELSNPCVSVNVMQVPDTLSSDVLLCIGDSYIFKDQIFSSPGTYYYVEDGIGLCDSIFQINISTNNLMSLIATPDTITCGGPGVLLDGSLSQGGMGPLSYEWTTEAGVISGNSANSQVVAMVPGTYRLTVRDGICESIRDVIVLGDMTFPLIFVEGGELTCNQTSITLNPVVVPSSVTYSWTGPGGFSSTMKVIDVSVPGRYFLRVVAANGCEIFTYADVIYNAGPPDLSIILFDKVCAPGYAIIGTTISNAIYEWQGPNPGIPSDQNIQISLPGDYSLTITDPITGCKDTATYFFNADYDLPLITLVGLDSLRCNQNVNLFIDPVGIPNVPFWSGPNGFNTTGYIVSLSQPGSYTVQVTGNNGCRNFENFEIFASNNYPAYTITNDTVSCLEPTATIGITIADADTYNWVGFNGPDSSNAFVQVSQPGIYFVTALDTNSGCMITAIARVVSNLAPPTFNFETDSISCNEPTGTLLFIPIAGQMYTDVQWQFPDMTIVSSPMINVNVPGQYLLSATGLNGCIGSSVLTVESDSIPPLFFLEADTLGCDLQGLIRNIRVDSLSSISWAGPGGFTSITLDPMVADTGLYIATGIGTNGCSAQVSTFVSGDFEPPSIFISSEMLTCLTQFAEFIALSPDSIIAYEWKNDAGMVIGVDSLISVSSPGIYTIQLEGVNHCLSLDSIDLSAAMFPTIELLFNTLTCASDSITISAGTNVVDPAFLWLNFDGDTLAKNAALIVDQSGPFIISITATNGCEVRDTILIPIDTIAPEAIISITGEVRCQNRDFMLDGSASVPSGLQFSWSNIGGFIIGPNDMVNLAARDTGIYILAVENPINGCTSVDSLIVTEHPDAIRKAFLEISPPACRDDANAQIMISGLLGGVDPILYQLDNTLSQISPVFAGLTAGTYLLRIVDAAGCLYDTTVTILPTNPYVVNAGSDIEIFIGESAMLSGETNILPEEIFSQDWDSMGIVFCLDCPESMVSPWMTSTYRFEVVSVSGCIVSDEVTVFVIEKGKFFIPNVFTPNGDNLNDEIRFYTSPGIVKVSKWIIFDRWGNTVFGRTDFDPIDPNVSWDGTMQGSETLNPGVFPYMIELELVNGNREVHHGTITLLR